MATDTPDRGKGESVKPLHFWIGTFVTIATVIGGWRISWVQVHEAREQTEQQIKAAREQTKLQIDATRQENRKARASTLLKEVSSATNAVIIQLRSQEDMYFQIERCQSDRGADNRICLRLKHEFDPSKFGDAWDSLGAAAKAASPYMETPQERQLLAQFSGMREKLRDDISAFLAPRSPEATKQARKAISSAKTNLRGLLEKLEREVAINRS